MGLVHALTRCALLWWWSQGCHPDAAVFNSLMEVLWQSGVLLAQAKALQLWTLANRSGHFRCGGGGRAWGQERGVEEYRQARCCWCAGSARQGAT